MRFYSAAQVRELDRRAIEQAGIPAYALMQRAAVACWRELTLRWPTARAVHVVCGSGNNGGDGYEIARLARSAGWAVRLWQVGDAPKAGAAAQARTAWLKDGGGADVFADDCLTQAELVVDALFGTGLSRPVQGQALAAVAAMNACRKAGAGVLAVDIPSGLGTNTGAVLGEAVHADLTVTFIGRKLGLYTGTGPDCAGKLVFDSLQVPAEVYQGLEPMAAGLGASGLAQLLPRRPRTAHKGSHGHVLLVGGDEGMAGAILLAGRAALRAGAGLVTVATRASHAAALTAAQPELMCKGVENAADLRSLMERATVVAVGPGLGQSRWSKAMWAQMQSAALPMVVDADGLNWLAHNPSRRDDWVLTPHPGEASRLLDIATQDVQADRPAAVARLRTQFGGVVVLKGAGTLVQGERLALCPYGNPGMAVGGMGDVLTGIIAGLMGQGLAPEAAAFAGVTAHALAGDRAAARGERGLLASDLLDELRGIINA